MSVEPVLVEVDEHDLRALEVAPFAISDAIVPAARVEPPPR